MRQMVEAIFKIHSALLNIDPLNHTWTSWAGNERQVSAEVHLRSTISRNFLCLTVGYKKHFLLIEVWLGFVVIVQNWWVQFQI